MLGEGGLSERACLINRTESGVVRCRSLRPTIPIPLCPNDLKLQIGDHAQQKQVDRVLRKGPPSPT
jgi:hypothetical protein